MAVFIGIAGVVGKAFLVAVKAAVVVAVSAVV